MVMKGAFAMTALPPNPFMTLTPNIDENIELRQPQKIAYSRVYEHFVRKDSQTHAIVVLPTGVGKTGLMALLPYGISKGRVLIITPQLVIKDNVVDSLNPDYPNNFWLRHNVFSHISDLPCLIEFEGKDTRDEWLQRADIVIVNIQKLQDRLESSLLRRVPQNFFDMIIIDEAHHSTATTWLDATRYFSAAKVVKLTGTPFRTDEDKIVGEIIYEYKLSAAMANNYVKSLENFTYVPGDIYLTIDGDSSKQYTIDQIIELNLRDEQWISRTVAYSEECSEKIVMESLKKLKEKLANNNPIPHKIIAVACSIPHAKHIQGLYAKHGHKSALIHSQLDNHAREAALSDIENHRVSVVIHVAMLGEGYDHPYLSIAAIFRPFRALLPYAQFVGRVLRVIQPNDNELLRASDNVAAIVTHRDMYLDKLWNFYKQELQESETIKHLADLNLDDLSDEEDSDDLHTVNKSVGSAIEYGTGNIISDTYTNTKLIEKRRQEEQDELRKVAEVQKLLSLNAEEARKIVQTAAGSRTLIKRPDLFIKRKRKGIDAKIKEDIVPMLLGNFNLDMASFDLKSSRLAQGSYAWIVSKARDNAGFLAIYITVELNRMIGRNRPNWSDSDWDNAEVSLTQIEKYLVKALEDFIQHTDV